jgi:hypothetical protein
MYFATLLVNRHVVRAVCPLPTNRITWFNVLCMLTDTWYVLSAHFPPFYMKLFVIYRYSQAGTFPSVNPVIIACYCG